MALKAILILLFFSCSHSEGLIVHHAGYRTYSGEYYGSEARISAWGIPDMNPNSSSEISVTLMNRDGDCLSFVRAGLHVFPSKYHDNKLRLFTLWSADFNKDNGCYNTLCPGFVTDDVNKFKIYRGQPVAPLSQYNGEDRYITIRIMKDPATQNWSSYRDDFNTSLRIGWWPKELFGDLANKVTSVQWVSYVSYQDGDTGPAMGSGHFAGEGKKKAAYVQDLQLFDKAGNGYSSPKISDLIREVDRFDSYATTPAASFGSEHHNDHKLYYGGPPGCRN